MDGTGNEVVPLHTFWEFASWVIGNAGGDAGFKLNQRGERLTALVTVQKDKTASSLTNIQDSPTVSPHERPGPWRPRLAYDRDLITLLMQSPHVFRDK
ncbi:hypothetical protein NX059_005644 [Plenodomus lindquistii]|nr:hypothetical protein NX059_005644 [Plenodomus lindquistii]